MPVYEYLCPECNKVFSFLVRSLSSQKQPKCPKCGSREMQRKISLFAAATSRGEKRAAGGEGPDLDDPRVEREMMKLMSQAESLDENDPKAMGRFMRKMVEISDESLGPGMEEALRRLESGEDPEKIEEEMGDVFDEEGFGGMGGDGGPDYDDGLYDL